MQKWNAFDWSIIRIVAVESWFAAFQREDSIGGSILERINHALEIGRHKALPLVAFRAELVSSSPSSKWDDGDKIQVEERHGRVASHFGKAAARTTESMLCNLPTAKIGVRSIDNHAASFAYQGPLTISNGYCSRLVEQFQNANVVLSKAKEELQILSFFCQ